MMLNSLSHQLHQCSFLKVKVGQRNPLNVNTAPCVMCFAAEKWRRKIQHLNTTTIGQRFDRRFFNFEGERFGLYRITDREDTRIRLYLFYMVNVYKQISIYILTSFP